MKKKLLMTGIVAVLTVALAIPVAQAQNQQDIGNYNNAELHNDDVNLYPTSRYRYAATYMIENNDDISEYDIMNSSATYLASGVRSSTGDRVTYEYSISNDEYCHMNIETSAPVNTYYKLKHRSEGFYNGYISLVGTWAPNSK